jgi:hypothetical protein
MLIVNLDSLTHEQNQELNSIARDIRTDYDRLIVNISDEYVDNIHWIVGSIASRNKYSSPLFMRCCKIVLVQRLLGRSESVNEVFTGDRALAEVLQKFYFEQSSTTTIRCTESIQNRTFRLLRPVLKYLIAMYFIVLRYIGSSSSKRKKLISDKPITLIDTFVLNNGAADEGGITDGVYKDRYYPGLMEQLTETEKNNIFYLPTISGFKNPIKAFNLIRSAKAPFLIHDDYLKISDYLYALNHPFKLIRCSFPHSKFHGVDIKPLLNEEKINHCSDFNGILGILYYRFSFRLKEAGIKVRLLVEWYENQVIDRAMIVGFHQYHPETKIIGYQGYVISKALHLYVYPNLSEYRSKAVPDIVYVVGEGLKDDLHEFCQDVVAEVAPAFRFNKLWRERIYTPDPKKFTVLIGLPIGLDDSAHILKLLSNAFNKLRGVNYQFWIKPHPTSGPELIKALLPGNWPQEFIFQKGDFHDVIEKSNLLISNASSVSLEALAKGVPTIIVAPQNGVLQNPIPETISNDAWSVIYNSIELADEIVRFEKFTKMHKDYFDQLGIDVRKIFFNPVSRENTIKFLEL